MDTSRTRSIARPHFVRAVISATLALAGLVVASQGQLQNRQLQNDRVDLATATERILAIAGAAALILFGLAAVRMFSYGVRAAAGEHLGDSRARPLGLVISVVGTVVVVLAALSVLGVEMSGLLLGGALTGVVVGIAAQQTLGNFFAGLVLLLVRPFSVGDEVVLRSGPLGGEYSGLVTDMGLFYVTLETELGPVQLPNAGVLASAVGPGARARDDEVSEENPGPAHGGPTSG